MPGLSIHVIDVSRGVPATDMRVELRALDAGDMVVCDALVAMTGLTYTRFLRLANAAEISLP